MTTSKGPELTNPYRVPGERPKEPPPDPERERSALASELRRIHRDCASDLRKLGPYDCSEGWEMRRMNIMRRAVAREIALGFPPMAPFLPWGGW